MARQWILDSQEGFETSLKCQEGVPIPSEADLPANGVLVKLFAASLNYRELMIADSTVSSKLFPDAMNKISG